jgi:hypothetical protein
VVAPVDVGRVEQAEPRGQVDRDALMSRSLLSLQRAAGNRAAVAEVHAYGPVAQRKAAGDPGARPTALLGSSGEHAGPLNHRHKCVSCVYGRT